jgi:hypothetical protein
MWMNCTNMLLKLKRRYRMLLKMERRYCMLLKLERRYYMNVLHRVLESV